MTKWLAILGATASLATSANAQTAVVDQVGPSEGNAGASINECCAVVLQTFTAGLGGELAGVSVQVYPIVSVPLNVAIRSVENGFPTSTVLASTTLSSPGTTLDQVVTFTPPPRIVAGRQYAIALSYPDALPGSGGGDATAATGDQYRGGQLLLLYDAAWLGDGAGVDLLFRTYVVPATNVSCGQIVTSDVKLNADLNCTVTAIVIGADNVTVDLNGHTLTGAAQSDPFWFGVRTPINTNFKNIRVINGTIEGFSRGVHIRNASGVVIQNLTISGSIDYGIFVREVTDLTIRNVNMSDVTTGISIQEATDVAMSDVRLTGPGNLDSFGLQSMGVLLSRVSGGDIRGIDVKKFLFGIKMACYGCLKSELPNSGSVKDSVFSDTFVAVSVYAATNMTVAGNHIIHAGTPDTFGGGIGVAGPATNVRLVDNTISDSNRGIFMERITGSWIAGNIVLRNVFGGIEMFSDSIGNKITSNTALNNGYDLWHDDSSSPNKWVDNVCQTAWAPDIKCIPPG